MVAIIYNAGYTALKLGGAILIESVLCAWIFLIQISLLFGKK